MKKILFFDLDQTILNRTESLKKFLSWQINFFQFIPQELKIAFIERFIELDNNGSVWKDIVYSQIIKEFGLKRAYVDRFLESYINDFNKFSVGFDQAYETIIRLYKKGHKLGLISNGKTPFQEHNFYALGLAEFFSVILISEAVGLRKSDPKIFNYACEKLDCRPSDCIFIGDNPIADIEGAKQIGMKTIFFHTTDTFKSPFCDKSIHHYNELEMAIHLLS
ncbi:HAD family hydrolase [Acinetobacter sp. WU_MDCI_Axc73]|nr:HAD family hydrolase [Acinetobacter sp. WU_MDCI_Axc73]